jgi:hypothetical protein
MRRCENCTRERPDEDLFWHRNDRKWYCQAAFVCEARLDILIRWARPADLERIMARDEDASGVTCA